VKPIRVLVVDDSSFNRKVISEILDGSGQIEVVGKAFDGEDALQKILRLQPDVMTLDLEMPNMDGFAVLRWVMANRPMPVIVVSARESDRSVFKALDLGAVDFVVKPTRTASPELKNMEVELLSKILSIPSLKLDRLRKRLDAAEPHPPDPPPQARGARRASVVAIAASTGGPPAIQRILQGLSKKILSPILVCQHMPPVFTRLFAERLQGLTGRTVREATDGEALSSRTVYIAPGGRQTRLGFQGQQVVLRVTERKAEDRFAPSANILLASLAEAYGRNCLCAVLTGMGDDGTEGSRAVHGAGGIVLAESEASAVIYGMPKEVVRAGVADHVADLDGIADLINRNALLDDGSLQSP
jgi:two-component system chemotaxis response regulator CheB